MKGPDPGVLDWVEVVLGLIMARWHMTQSWYLGYDAACGQALHNSSGLGDQKIVCQGTR